VPEPRVSRGVRQRAWILPAATLIIAGLLLLPSSLALASAGVGSAPARAAPIAAFDPSARALAAAAATFAPPGPLVAGPWVNLTSGLATAPGAREGAQMAYDPSTQQVILFGGLARNRSLADTWAFSGGRWTNLTPSLNLSPPARYKGGMAFDTADNYLVLFGGNGGSLTYLNDTWAWNGSAWSRLNSTVSPGPREDVALTYDAADGYVVLFGGEAPSGLLTNDTWTFNAGQWTNLTSSIRAAPPPREAGGFTYDGADQYVLLFSGKHGSNGLQRDTWTYKAGVWTNLTSTLSVAPGPRESMSLSYDFVDGYVLLFGGFRYPNALNDEWTFAGGKWTRLTVTNPPPARSDAAMAYFPNLGFGYVLLFGGRSSPLATGVEFGDTWSYKQPLTITATASAPAIDLTESLTLSAVVHGGYTPYVLAWTSLPAGCTGGNTTLISCTPTVPTNTTTLVSVNDSSGTNVSASVAVLVNADPTATANASVSAGVAPLVVNFTGAPIGGTAPFVANWSFGDGTYSAATTVSHTYAAGSYNATFGIVDARGFGVTVHLAPIVVTTAPGPLTAVASAIPTAGPAPLAVQFYVTPAGGTAPYTVDWAFGPAGAGSSLQNPDYTYTTQGIYTATVTVHDALGNSVAHQITINVSAAPPAPLAASVSATPTSGTAPLTVAFTTSASGGSAPYAFAWTFGTAGATSAAQDPSYTYTAAGTFSANLTVTDAAQTVVHKSVTITVRAALSASFVASVGAPYCSGGQGYARVNLTASATGGSSGYSYAWTYPGGAATGPTASIVLGAPASVAVRLTVVDASASSFNVSQTVSTPATSCSSANGTAGPGVDWLVIGLIALVAVIIAIELLVLARRRRK
jgi:PKD repeat protein